jgi:hypothetical protein
MMLPAFSVAIAQLTVAAPSPTPAPVTTLNANSVTPGLVGFLAIFFVAVAVIFLMIDMVRRIRRIRYRQEIAEKLDAEQAASGAPAVTQATSSDEAAKRLTDRNGGA